MSELARVSTTRFGLRRGSVKVTRVRGKILFLGYTDLIAVQKCVRLLRSTPEFGNGTLEFAGIRWKLTVVHH